MEKLTLNFEKLSASVETFRETMTGTFLELQASAGATIGMMSESFSVLAQNANLSFSDASLGMQQSF